MSHHHSTVPYPGSARAVAIAVLAACATTFAPPLLADDGEQGKDPTATQTAQEVLQLLKQLDTLQGAGSAQTAMQDGFAVGETFSTLAGQPEAAAGLKLLQGILDFSGAFSSSSSNATTQALSTLTKSVVEMKAQIASLQSTVNTLAVDIVSDHNQALTTALFAAHQYFSDKKDELYPSSTLPSGASGKGTQRRVTGAAETTADRATAGRIASELAGELDLFMLNEDQYFLGDDVQTDPKSGLKTPAPGLKPYPALTTYLLGMQLWITAMEVESGGTDDGYAKIQGDKRIQAWLAKHIAFLRAKSNGGADPHYASPIQDRIVASQHCQWNLNGYAGSSSSYSDAKGLCGATLACQDSIARTKPRIPATSIQWRQQPNTFCMLAADGSQPLANGGTASDLLNPIERTLQQQYGLLAMDRMAAMLAQIAHLGTARQGAQVAQPGNFGGKSDAPFFVYAIDASGAVKNYTGYRNQPLPQPSAVGNIAGITALIPGGGTTFYAISKDGKLNWYQFTGNSGGKPFNGPVTVASGFGAYKQVFGGGDGVIYAIGSDGTLVWYRHAGFASGGAAATMSGPKVVGSGFGQYKRVFSAGDGVIYAIQNDGSLVWYQHKSFLTGAADAPKTPANTHVETLKAAGNLVAVSQLQGPVTVGSGWAGFRQVIPAGNGVVLAVQNDGTLLWYRHDDYLTGVSTGAAIAGGANGAVAGAHPANWQTAAAAANQHEGVGGSASAPNWGAPAQPSVNTADSAPHVAGAASQWGAPIQHGATPTAPAAPSVLHGASESQSSLHPATSLPNPNKPGPAATHENMAAPAALGAAGRTPHWEGPMTIAAQSGWNGFTEIAAILPVTVQTNAIK